MCHWPTLADIIARQSTDMAALLCGFISTFEVSFLSRVQTDRFQVRTTTGTGCRLPETGQSVLGFTLLLLLL